MRRERWISAGVAMLVIGLPVLSTASSGRQKDVIAAPMAYFEQFVPANVGYTIETRNLAPSTADTVIHVQDGNDANGGFVAGNDDFSGLASRVVINPATNDRFLQIIVRAYGGTTGGTAELVRTSTTGVTTVNAIAFGGVTMVTVPGGMIASGHAFTVEQQGGPNDTVLLVISGSLSSAIAFDDDDGIDRMSWLHINAACSSGSCYIVPGTRMAGDAGGVTTVMWDEGAHASTVCDADGVSDSLESAVGTNPCDIDSDDDGLSDGVELNGVVEGGAGQPAVKLAYYGADPLRKDVFVELDWVECTTQNGRCADNTRPDLLQTPGSVALGAASYFGPDVAVHFDTGVTNGDPATRASFGHWGGATRIPDGTGYCQMLTPSRVGLFHHGIIAGNNGGGRADSINGFCFTAGNTAQGSAIAHELAHGFGLAHGGLLSNDVNCKPHYRSIMNYSYLYDPAVKQFSRGEFSNVVLNPVAMDESRGLGTSDTSRIAFLSAAPWHFTVGTSGSVDWNRDGLVGAAGTLIGGAPSWAAASCEQSVVGRFDLHIGYGPTAAWVRPAAGPARHYVVSRVTGGGGLEYRYSANLASCRQQPAYPCADWTPPLGAAPATWPVNRGGSNAPAAARLVMPDGSDRLAVVYSDTARRLVLDLLRVDASGNESVVNAVAPGTDVIESDMAVVPFSGKLLVFAMVAGQVKRWEYNPATGAFAAPVVELYSNGQPVTVGLGMAITTGYQSGNSSLQLYGIFPSAGTAPHAMTMARYEASTSRWVQFSSTIFPSAGFRTSVRPGIAFVPFSPSAPTVGRFFLMWQDGVTQTSMTQGNDVTPGATSRALRWLFQLDFQNVWAVSQSGVGMAFDPLFDLNPRATWSHVNGWANVAPLADGIYNLPLRDFDDYTTITRNLSCSLTRSCQ